MTEPTKVGDTLEIPTPSFTPCELCKQLTTGSRCYDCVREAHRLTRARQELEDTIPGSFKWARFGCPELRERTSGHGIIGRAENAVGSIRAVLIGASGTGKTSLAVCMARAWVEHRKEHAAFMLATDLASARGQFGHRSAEVELALVVPLLVLDDMGTEGEGKDNPVTTVIFKRHAEGRATVITTWMGQDAMAARYGGGITRRVFEGARIIDCGGK